MIQDRAIVTMKSE